jgi:hypothetical protein
MNPRRTSTKSKHPDKIKKSSRIQKVEENQGAPGDLHHQIKSNDKDNQSSQGDLENGSQTELSCFKKSVESVPISNIQHFSSIPDFVDRTLSPHPIIVITPSASQCIDGWELIEEARQQGEQQITCEIIHTNQDTEIDVALWKTSVRMRPPGGTCSYAESVRNVRELFAMIMASQEDPKIYSHGGDRRSQNFTDNNREDNIPILLERRLGKSAKTINQYFNHAKFLDDFTLEKFIRASSKKVFFEKVQPKKRMFIRDLKSDGSSDETITTKVSQKMASWFQEYQITGDISSDDIDSDGNDGNSSEGNAGEGNNSNNNQSNTLKTFTPWQGRDESDLQSTPSEEDIKRAIDTATIPIIRCRNGFPMDLELLLNLIPEAIDHLVQVNQMALFIRNSKSNNKEV